MPTFALKVVFLYFELFVQLNLGGTFRAILSFNTSQKPEQTSLPRELSVEMKGEYGKNNKILLDPRPKTICSNFVLFSLCKMHLSDF